jgi:hypothetical protein
MTARPSSPSPSSGCSPRTVSAEPPVKHAISVRERWKAGDVFTRTGEETETVKIKVLADGQPVSDRTQDRQVSYHTVGKVLEADEAGHATKTVLYFVAWSQAGRGAQDGSLSGVLVEVAGRGAARANRILSPDAQVSEAAQRWLDLTGTASRRGPWTPGPRTRRISTSPGATWPSARRGPPTPGRSGRRSPRACPSCSTR